MSPRLRDSARAAADAVDPEALIADLNDLDNLDVSAIDLSPESPMGSAMGSIETAAGLWTRVVLIALGFFAVLALVVVISVVMHR